MTKEVPDMINETADLVEEMRARLEGKDSIIVLNACINLTVQVMKDLEIDPRVCIMAFSKTLAMYMDDESNKMVSQIKDAELN